MARQHSDIEGIRQANDIVDVVGEHLRLRRAGSGYKGLCPFHRDEKSPSFHVNQDRQTFKCFGCGVGGDVFKFIQLRENVDFGEALRILAGRAGIELTPRSTKNRQDAPDRSTLLRVNEWAASWFRQQLQESPAGQNAREYVAQRQISDETTARFGLGFAPNSYDETISRGRAAGFAPAELSAAGITRTTDFGKPYAVFRNRLMFPIRDSSRRIIGFGGRTLGDDPAKYLNSPETMLFNKGRELFGLDLARESMSQSGRVVVTEGYTDCLMLHQHGITNVVAALGTSFTPDQARLLHRFCDEVIMVFDSDEAGQRAANRALEAALAEAMTVRLAHVPEGKDPCDYVLSAGPKAFEALLNSASEALEFKWHQLARMVSGTVDPSQNQRAVTGFLEMVARVMAQRPIEPVHLGYIANRMSKLVALPAEVVYRHLTKRSRQETRAHLRSKNTAADGAGDDRPLSTRDLAVRVIMEVLLNDPSYFETSGKYLMPDRISDPRLSRIVSEFCSASRSPQEYDLAGFISGFEEPADAALITDMQWAGEHRGNYEATLQGALDLLRQEQVSTQESGPASTTEESTATRLARVQKASEQRHHFAGSGRHLTGLEEQHAEEPAMRAVAEGNA